MQQKFWIKEEIEMTEIMKTIDISLLLPFENHPFKERCGTEQEELLEHKRKRIA